MADGFVDGDNLICGLHNWDYRIDTGISEYNNAEALPKFESWIENGKVLVDADEIAAWAKDHPAALSARRVSRPLRRRARRSGRAACSSDPDLCANEGLSKTGHHGVVEAMGVPRQELPSWDDIQIVTAQLATPPQLDDAPVGTEVVIGPNAQKPLRLKIPLIVSDMSFGSLSEPAKVALAKGAELAGTGICSGEGGMLAEEQAANSRYFYELASARFGFSWDKVLQGAGLPLQGRPGGEDRHRRPPAGPRCRPRSPRCAGSRSARTRSRRRAFPTGPRSRSSGPSPTRCASAPAASRSATSSRPSTSRRTSTPRSRSAATTSSSTAAAAATGAAPLIFRDNISVPTIPGAGAGAPPPRCQSGRKDVTLIITGGLRTPADFAKALALGADAVALANSAIQAIGCIGMRACHTNNCPVGIATQKPHLMARLDVEKSAERLARFLETSVELMKILARACGHTHLNQLSLDDLTTWKEEMARLSGVPYGGVGAV